MAPKEKRDSLLQLEDQLMALSTRLDDERERRASRRRSSALTTTTEEDNTAKAAANGEEEKKQDELEGLSTINSVHSTMSSLADFSSDDEDDSESDDDNDSFASSWRSGVDLLGDFDDDDTSVATTKSQALFKLNEARNSASELLDSEKLKAQTRVATIPRPRSNTKLCMEALGA